MLTVSSKPPQLYYTWDGDQRSTRRQVYGLACFGLVAFVLDRADAAFHREYVPVQLGQIRCRHTAKTSQTNDDWHDTEHRNRLNWISCPNNAARERTTKLI